MEARRSNPHLSFMEDEAGSILRVERAHLPNGTIYELSATWIPKPSVLCRRTKSTQTGMD